jgi:hypothetical protein
MVEEPPQKSPEVGGKILRKTLFLSIDFCKTVNDTPRRAKAVQIEIVLLYDLFKRYGTLHCYGLR